MIAFRIAAFCYYPVSAYFAAISWGTEINKKILILEQLTNLVGNTDKYTNKIFASLKYKQNAAAVKFCNDFMKLGHDSSTSIDRQFQHVCILTPTT